MLVLYFLGCFISGTFCRQSPAVPPGLAVYRTANPSQFLVQSLTKTATEIPQGYSQIAVVVLPRQPILQAITQAPLPERTTENEDHNSYVDNETEFPRNEKQQPLTYAQLLTYPSSKKRIYPKQQNLPSIQQFLKEVIPTTKTVYSEQQAASLRYAQATPPPHQDVQKFQPQRIVQHSVPVTYTVQPETQNDREQLEHYSQIVQPPQLIQVQPNIHPQQIIQPYSYIPREQPPQPKYQQIQPQTTHGSLTYIPINPVMFQKPLVDDDTPSAKSAVYVTQKTAVKKYHSPQPVTEDENDDNLEKPEPLPRKEHRLIPQLISLSPQQFLIPIFSQPPPTANEGLPPGIQPQLIRYHQIQPSPGDPQQFRPEPVVQQQIYVQIRPKKVPQQVLRQPSQPLQPPQQSIVTYQPFPIQQLQPVDPAAFQRPPTIKYILPPQLLAYPQLQPVGLRQLPPPQQEPLDYESPQEETPQQRFQEEDRNEEKPDIQLLQPVQRTQNKRKKTGLRSRNNRPSRVQQESEDETQNENQESQSNTQEEFRIQYPDGLRSQASNVSGLRYRRPTHANSRQNLSSNKERAVQIIDKEDEDYK